MWSSNSLQLSINSTLGDLPSYNFQVKGSTLTEVVETEFIERAELPGVIVMDKLSVIGFISRQKFFEQMSQEYSREIYLKRPIEVLLKITHYESLQIPVTCKINKAVTKALQRPQELIFEPIIVIDKNRELRILELNLLVLAQSQIFAQMNGIIKAQEESTRQYAESLKKEREKVEEYAKQLEAQKLEVEKRNQILEDQSNQLLEQRKQIANLNERFAQIGSLLSTKGKKTFEEMLQSVDRICGKTDQIIGIGGTLNHKLIVVDQATQSIKQVSKNVQVLSSKVSVLSSYIESLENQSGDFNEQSELRIIAEEIDNLGYKTLKATTQVNLVATQFKNQIKQLTEAARNSQEIAQLLVEHSEQTQDAIAELEKLLAEYSWEQQMREYFLTSSKF